MIDHELDPKCDRHNDVVMRRGSIPTPAQSVASRHLWVTSGDTSSNASHEAVKAVKTLSRCRQGGVAIPAEMLTDVS